MVLEAQESKLKMLAHLIPGKGLLCLHIVKGLWISLGSFLSSTNPVYEGFALKT